MFTTHQQPLLGGEHPTRQHRAASEGMPFSRLLRQKWREHPSDYFSLEGTISLSALLGPWRMFRRGSKAASLMWGPEWQDFCDGRRRGQLQRHDWRR
jgi:hypothetical protein